MGFIELFEIGFFTAFWNFSVPFISISVYLSLILGVAIQLVLLKKNYKKVLHKLLFGICAVGILVCECVWHTIIGWDRFLVDYVYLLFISLLLGTIIATIVFQIKGKTQHT